MHLYLYIGAANRWRELDTSLRSIDHAWPNWACKDDDDDDDDGSSKPTTSSHSKQQHQQTVDSGSNDIDEILRAGLEAEAEVLRMLVSNKQKSI